MVPRAPPQPPRLYVFAKARSPAKCLLRFISLIFSHSRGRKKPKSSFPVHVGGGVCSLCCRSLPGRELGRRAVWGIGFCPSGFPSLLVCTCLGVPRIFLKILAGYKPFRLIFSKNGVLNITIPTNIFFERAYSSLSILDINWKGLKILSWIYLKTIEPAVLESGLLIRAYLF